MNREVQTSLQSKDISLENKSLSEERLLKEKKAQDRFNYLVRTRNKIEHLIRFK